MTDAATDFTYDELILTTLARQLQDGDRVFTGVASPIQMMAIFLLFYPLRAEYRGIIAPNIRGLILQQRVFRRSSVRLQV